MTHAVEQNRGKFGPWAWVWIYYIVFTWVLLTYQGHFWGNLVHFLGIVCATAQQSYLLMWCRHSLSVRPSSTCKTHFSETVRQINTKFYGKVAIHHISRAFFFFFFKIEHFDF